MDRGAWWTTVHGSEKSRARLSDFTFFQFRRQAWQNGRKLHLKKSQLPPPQLQPRRMGTFRDQKK